MTSTRKSKLEAETLGAELRTRRKYLGLSLEDLQKHTGVNASQISRFEQGNLKFVSKNLQKLLDYLQSIEASSTESPDLVRRFALLLNRSARHEVAASALVSALEQLQ
ncbi:helix-turn-helix transcriptional regulator [Polaromonas sp.]|uniref:helix-turn-helix domain-containing protein n=1 Tax=Polaromonas sp. TaxID=1869339 RepID=UPI002488DD25|nr:helix-turn-helix transcriptional regulator [Polaromonas sp.]MDI1338448.1 helix-turn-helix transcriptional regulator [Polaromonas sp.]